VLGDVECREPPNVNSPLPSGVLIRTAPVLPPSPGPFLLALAPLHDSRKPAGESGIRGLSCCRPIGASAWLASACGLLPKGLLGNYCAVTTRPVLGLERRPSLLGVNVMSNPNNDRLFYLCPRCEAGYVSWEGKKDLQKRKLFVCDKDERHISTLESLRRASRRRRMLD
jgi:hypothetical protein